MKWHQIDWNRVNLDVITIQQQIVRAYIDHDHKMVLKLPSRSEGSYLDPFHVEPRL